MDGPKIIHRMFYTYQNFQKSDELLGLFNKLSRSVMELMTTLSPLDSNKLNKIFKL